MDIQNKCRLYLNGKLAPKNTAMKEEDNKMQDRFKLRIYDTEKAHMFGVHRLEYDMRIDNHDERRMSLISAQGYAGDSGGWYNVFGGANTKDKFVIMQCTGLHDKNGVLIFEGDVCEFKCFGILYIGSITHNKKTSALEMCNDVIVGAYGEKATNTRLLCHCNDIKIIGNIYDNPGLLGGAK